MMMVAELRKYQRVSTNLEIMYHTVKEVKEGENPVPTHYFGTVTDLSKGGAGLLVDYPHNPDDKICLEGIAGYKKPMDGVIRWIREHSGNYRVGVKFIQG
jgi:c-di-GMP-binding flagellar brake protein YcgR